MAAIIKGFKKTTKLEGGEPFQLIDFLKCLFLFSVSSISKRRRQENAAICLSLILSAHFAALAPVFAQTPVVPQATNTATVPGDSQVPSQDGQSQTQNTVPNQYQDAIGTLYQVDQAIPPNQNNINNGVQKILTGYSTPVVFMAAEQSQGGQVQQAANNILNASLGSVNDTYRGLHQWWKDDLVGNLFQNIGQLFGKWLSEFIDGWIADTAQFLAKFLRVFVLNPNIAVNGLNGSQNDGISPYIRQGADIMYGIAVDLLLLLFILCIWKFWADASWNGAGNLMGPVGRLIFTAGLLLAWPTIYAFEIQISNEMIKAIYFNSADQVLMLDFALAQAVRGGVIAAGAGATSVFAPLLANLAIPVAGQFVGSLFYFASTMIFTVLGGILIAELIYILILKAIQTALLTAQYMFAPIFLVFFATPDTESYATGYVRAFCETSLWTFVWVGLLKVMTIVMFSNFNPWGKILISIGVLQLMIQVPSFLGRAQISPVSDFITAGLVFGTVSKAVAGLGSGLTTAVGSGVSWFTDGRFSEKGLQQTKDASMNGLPSQTSAPELLNALNKASTTERNRHKEGPGFDPNLAAGPTVKTPGSGTEAGGAGAAGSAGQSINALPPIAKPDGKPADKPLVPAVIDPTTGKPLVTPKPPDKTDPTTIPVPPLANKPPEKPPTGATVTVPPGKTAGLNASGVVTAGALAAGLGAVAAGLEGHNALHGSGNPELPKGKPPDDPSAKTPTDRFEYGKSTAEGWNESNLIHVDTRKLLGQLTSVNGVGLRTGQDKTSALGSAQHGVQRINIGQNETDAGMAHAIYAAAFANNIATDDPAKDAARKAAVQAKGSQPHGLMENMAANWLSNTGSSWSKTAIAKERFQQSMFEAAVKGSQAYVSRQPGNAYTEYLRGRYGEWGDDQDAMAVHLITNPESSESPWNRNIGPATDGMVQKGIPIGADTRGAMQNVAIQGKHPTLQKLASFAVLSYTYPMAKALYGNEDPSVFKLAHGEMARALPAEDVDRALAMYQVSGQDDLNSPMATMFMASSGNLANTTQRDFATAYACQATAAPYQARRLGYISQSQDLSSIHSFADLSAIVVPKAGETHAQAMQVILEGASNTLGTLEAHKIPMTTVLNPALASGVFAALAHLAPEGLNTLAGSRAMSIVSRNLSTPGVMHDAHTIEAMYSYEQNGGNANTLDQAHVILASRALSDLGPSRVNPHVIEVALNQGYASASPGSAIPWADVEKAAVPYQSGQVKDYRLAGMVGQFIGSKIPVNHTNLQIGVESVASNSGRFDADQVRAIIRVTEAVRSSSSAPIVLETFARAQAAAAGISNTSNMNLGQVLTELSSKSGPGKDYSPGGIAQSIVEISRQGGGFSDHQLQDQNTVQMIVENSSDQHRYVPQAINVVTRLVGSTEAMNHPEYISVVEEYLDNDGRMKDMDLGSLHAAAGLSEVKNASILNNSRADEWSSVKITPQVLKMMQRDSGYSINKPTDISPSLIDKILQTANRLGGGGGGASP